MTAKEIALDAIAHLPDSATIEEIMEALYVRKKMADGLADIEAGRVVSNDEAKKRFEAWLQK